MSSAESVIDFYRKVSQKSDSDIDVEITSSPEQVSENILEKDTQEPFESFVVVLAETLKQQQKLKENQKPITIEKKEESVQKETAEPFESFIVSLAGALEKDKLKKKIVVTEFQSPQKESQEEIIPDDIILSTKEKTLVDHYTEELNKDKKNEPVQSEEEVKIKSLVSKQINEEINRTRQIFPNIGMSGGGGGTNAVQFANGGTMNGDLNVLGKYLSGGVELSDILKSGGGGFVDKLISGSQTLILSSNGSLVFQNNDNNITFVTSTDYKWIFDDQGVLTTPQNTLTTKNFNTTGILLSSGINLNELFLPKEELIVDGGQY